MPKFDIETIEKHECRCTYNGVEATDREAALAMVRRGDVAYTSKEPTEQDELISVVSIEEL